MKTTYIKLFAGLGNQIFQYCYGLLKQIEGVNIHYILTKTYDKSGNCYDIPEVFDLFDINGKPAKNIFSPEKFLPKTRINAKKVFAKYIIKSYETGFYQKADYIEKVTASRDIHEFLAFKNENKYRNTDIYKRIEECKNSVSLHIRGGDYLGEGSPYSGICTNEYYKKAILYFMENTENPHFFIFTNDKPFCSAVLSPLGIEPSTYTIVEDDPFLKDDPGFDLFLMSKCSNNIVANSTYSWWGAYLNRNKSKIIITPSQWTTNNAPSLEDIKIRDWLSL